MRELRLADIPITDAALKDIGRLTKLKLISLGNIPVTDAGLAELGKLAELERLELSNTRVTGTGFEKLKVLKKLRHVFLDGTSATDAAVHVADVVVADVAHEPADGDEIAGFICRSLEAVPQAVKVPLPPDAEPVHQFPPLV